jgi:DNA relaxase NicK
LSSVDDIKISVNLGQIQTLKNSASYWRGANQICQQLITVAKNNRVPLSQLNQNIVYGNIELVEFKFTGFGKSDMFRQCESFVNAKNLSSVDDIVRVTNFGTERILKNSASYWRGTLEICQQVLAEIP